MDSLSRLLDIMARLRGESGCPWDREQTPASLRTYVLEEAHEVAEAIDELDVRGWETLRDELGDLLLQVVFLSRIAEEGGHFAFGDVAAAIGDKLVRRHPHVFAGLEVAGVEEVWKNWDEIKRDEKARRGESAHKSRLDGVPRALPALAKARLYADKASRAGFDWPHPPAIADKISEELAEIRMALARGETADAGEEIGDLVFAAASLARRLGLDPEACAESANRKFAARFRRVEALAAQRGLRLEERSASELDALWNEAKRL